METGTWKASRGEHDWSQLEPAISSLERRWTEHCLRNCAINSFDGFGFGATSIRWLTNSFPSAS